MDPQERERPEIGLIDRLVNAHVLVGSFSCSARALADAVGDGPWVSLRLIAFRVEVEDLNANSYIVRGSRRFGSQKVLHSSAEHSPAFASEDTSLSEASVLILFLLSGFLAPLNTKCPIR